MKMQEINNKKQKLISFREEEVTFVAAEAEAKRRNQKLSQLCRDALRGELNIKSKSELSSGLILEEIAELQKLIKMVLRLLSKRKLNKKLSAKNKFSNPETQKQFGQQFLISQTRIGSQEEILNDPLTLIEGETRLAQIGETVLTDQTQDISPSESSDENDNEIMAEINQHLQISRNSDLSDQTDSATWRFGSPETKQLIVSKNFIPGVPKSATDNGLFAGFTEVELELDDNEEFSLFRNN